MVGDGFAVRDPHRLLEHRVDVGRAVELDPDFGLTEHRHVVVGDLGQRHGFVLLRPLEPAALGLEPGPGAPGFCAGQQHHARAALLDIQAGLVDQRLRHVSADGAVHGSEVGRRADTFPEQQPGVSVVGREHVHHADGVDGLEHPRIGSLPGRGNHQVEWFDGRGVWVDLVAVVDLAVADQHRCSGVNGHGVKHSVPMKRGIGSLAALPRRT